MSAIEKVAVGVNSLYYLTNSNTTESFSWILIILPLFHEYKKILKVISCNYFKSFFFSSLTYLVQSKNFMNKSYINGVILRGQNLSLKCCQSLEQNYVRKGSKFFQRDTVTLCRSKGCKVTVRETLGKIQLYGTQTRTARMWFDSSQAV